MVRTSIGIIVLGFCAAASSGCGGAPYLSGGTGTMPADTAHSRNGSGYKLLYSFRGGSDGADPGGGLVAGEGLFYGTTLGRGCVSSCAPGSAGTVFAATSSGSENVLYSFKGLPDAISPTFQLLQINGTLCGTTQRGGTYNLGTVFAVSKSGSERVLHSFKGGRDGAGPFGSLIALHGKLYGTTAGGGGLGCRSLGCGTIFETAISGKERIIYAFKGYPHDGQQPVGSLVAKNGMLYGATWVGGHGGCADGCGTVFEVSTSGRERVLHIFRGAPDGENPSGGLAVVRGVLYGTTVDGGTRTTCQPFPGCGTVYSVSTSGTERILYSFKDRRDGSEPNGGLIEVDGALYGTGEGGVKCPPNDECGSLFRVTTGGSERVLYRFKGQPDGAYPQWPLAHYDKAFYGATEGGGAYGNGALFTFAQ